MKFKYNLNLKRYILLILSFMIISIFIYYIFVYYKEKAFIRSCLESCYHDIYYYVRQEDSKRFLGQYPVRIGTEKILLLSSYYNDYIINKENIMLYLEGLNWKDIILSNKHNICDITEDVRNGYINYIQLKEQNYTLELLQNIDIKKTKEMIANVLYILGENLELNPLHKATVTSNVFIMNILENIDWNLYIRTVEFKKAEFTTLIKFYYEHINIIEQIFNNNSNFSQLYPFIRNSLLIYIIVVNLLYTIPAFIVVTFCKKAIFAYVLHVLTTETTILMTRAELHDLCYRIVDLIIKNYHPSEILEGLLLFYFTR